MQMLYTERMSEWNPRLPGNMHALTAGRVGHGCAPQRGGSRRDRAAARA